MPQNGINAVVLRGVQKSYGRGQHKVHVLNDLNMTVPRGAIYGLLGPSGCGKTTLLRCILGQLKVEKGSVITFGRTPGDRQFGVPGHRVGYMPQELALFHEFTIGETFSFFGRIHGMTSLLIRQRTNFLIEFLTLPPANRLVSQLSGGQKRRVSLAAALLQEPELLILDEPTVGVDPVLRKKIWEHLLAIAQCHHQKTTIIITTHYVEEARQADKVGMMRSGRLLGEDSPTALLERHNLQSLEKLFLCLCEKDNVVHDEDLDGVEGVSSSLQELCEDTPSDYMSLPYSQQIPDNPEDKILFDDVPVIKKGDNCCDVLRMRNILALVIKDLTVMKRKIGFLIFQFFLPTIQIVLFCLCIGRDPYDLHMGVTNQDAGNLGARFLSYIDNNTITQVPYDNLTGAIHSVETGSAWGAISLSSNFSKDIIKRFAGGTKVTNATIDGSTIKLYLDMTNQQIAIISQQKVDQAFFDFYRDLLSETGNNPQLANIPVQVQKPVYGSLNPSFTNFMAPGIILSITYFMATGLTTMSFVIEKAEGLLDRNLTTGVTAVEIMLAHVLTQFLVLSVQVALLLVFALVVFQIPYEGPLIWVIILVLLQGFTGMTQGMVFSVLCEKEHEAVQMAIGSMFPNLLLSGIIWPLEAVPIWLRYISVCLPVTYAAEAMRSIIGRGWSIMELAVWRGYLVTIGWSTGFLLIAAIILKIKQ